MCFEGGDFCFSFEKSVLIKFILCFEEDFVFIF